MGSKNIFFVSLRKKWRKKKNEKKKEKEIKEKEREKAIFQEEKAADILECSHGAQRAAIHARS